MYELSKDIENNDFFMFLQSLKDNGSKEIVVDTDFKVKNNEQLKVRDEEYSKLITEFVKDYTNRVSDKKKNKQNFFILMFVLAFILLIGSLVLLFKNPNEIVVIIGSIIGLLSAVISIPLTITKYLFNPDEDKIITEVVIAMQEQDRINRDQNNNY